MKRILWCITVFLVLPTLVLALDVRKHSQTRIIPDNSTGSAASDTITLFRRYVEITCLDPNDCNITISTLSKPHVEEVKIVCLTNFLPQKCKFANSDFLILPSIGEELGHYDVLELTYVGYGTWAKVASSNNVPPTPTPTPVS